MTLEETTLSDTHLIDLTLTDSVEDNLISNPTVKINECNVVKLETQVIPINTDDMDMIENDVSEPDCINSIINNMKESPHQSEVINLDDSDDSECEITSENNERHPATTSNQIKAVPERDKCLSEIVKTIDQKR